MGSLTNTLKIYEYLLQYGAHVDILNAIRHISLCEKMTSSTKPNIALSPEEDRTMATVNMYRKFREVWTCGF